MNDPTPCGLPANHNKLIYRIEGFFPPAIIAYYKTHIFRKWGHWSHAPTFMQCFSHHETSPVLNIGLTHVPVSYCDKSTFQQKSCCLSRITLYALWRPHLQPLTSSSATDHQISPFTFPIEHPLKQIPLRFISYEYFVFFLYLQSTHKNTQKKYHPI